MTEEPGFDRQLSLITLAPEAAEDAAEAGVPVAILSKPVRRLSPGELRILVQHHGCLPYAVPLALEYLAEAPLLEAEAHPGDLLTALLECDTRFWQEHYDLWLETAGVVAEAVEAVQRAAAGEERDDYMPAFLGDDFMGALLHFRGIHDASSG